MIAKAPMAAAAVPSFLEAVSAAAPAAASTASLLPEIAPVAEATLPQMIDPLIVNDLWDGVGAMPQGAEALGADFLDGKVQNLGAALKNGEWDYLKGFGTNLAKNPFMKAAGTFGAATSLLGGHQPPQQPQNMNVQNIRPARLEAQPLMPQQPTSFLGIAEQQAKQAWEDQQKYRRAFGKVPY